MRLKYFSFLLLLLLISCGIDDEGGDLEITLPVSVQDIKPSSIEEFVQSTGSVKAIKQAVLTSEVDGKYFLLKNPRTKKLFKPGDIVKKGEVIVHLENKEHENQIKIESHELNLDITSREYEKQKSLYEKGGVTLRELINSERSYIDAKYALDNAKIQLAKLKFIAPFNGVLVDLPYYTPGGEINMNLLIVEIMDYHILYTEVNFPAKEIINIKTGQRVMAIDYTVSDDTLWGKIKDVTPAINPTTRSFKATIIINNPKLLFRPGMFVQMETIVASKDSAIVIPKEIVLSKRRGKTVFIVQKGAAVERVINTGLENNDMIEVIEGLKIDERVVIKGFETLRNRSKIKIVQ